MILNKRVDGYHVLFPAGRQEGVSYQIRSTAMRLRSLIHCFPAIEGALRC